MANARLIARADHHFATRHSPLAPSPASTVDRMLPDPPARDDDSAAAPPASPTPSLELAPGVRVHPSTVRFAYARSSGPGGQAVNKLSTKAELRIRLADLPLTDRALARLRTLAGSRLTLNDELILTSESHRSQRRNRDETLDRLRDLLLRATAEPKRRKKTRPSRGAIERRLKAKKERGEKKDTRRRVDE